MKLKFYWIPVVLCALLSSASLFVDANSDNVNDAVEVIQEKMAAMPLAVKVHTDLENSPVEMLNEEPPKSEAEVTIVQVKQENAQESKADTEKKIELVKIDEATSDKDIMSAVLESKKGGNIENDTFEAAINAETIKEPGMQRLARQLKRFHYSQLARNNIYPKGVGRRASTNFDEYDIDDEVVPEERAVRRRKRVRRRNTKNKIKRTHRNKHVANRKKSSRRKLSNNNSVKRKNVRKSISKKRKNKNNMRAGNSSKRNRNGSNGNQRRKSGSKNRNVKRKSSGKRKTNKKRSKSSNRNQKNANSGRKGYDDNDDMSQQNVNAIDGGNEDSFMNAGQLDFMQAAVASA